MGDAASEAPKLAPATPALRLAAIGVDASQELPPDTHRPGVGETLRDAARDDDTLADFVLDKLDDVVRDAVRLAERVSDPVRDAETLPVAAGEAPPRDGETEAEAERLRVALVEPLSERDAVGGMPKA